MVIAFCWFMALVAGDFLLEPAPRAAQLHPGHHGHHGARTAHAAGDHVADRRCRAQRGCRTRRRERRSGWSSWRAAPAYPGAQHEPPDRHADRQRAPDAAASSTRKRSSAADLVREAVDRLSRTAAPASAKAWWCGCTRDFLFNGSRALFLQVIDNLMKNALRSLAAATSRQPAGRPADRGRRAAAAARSSSPTTAWAWTPTLQARIFEPFFSTDRGTGHGLGLAFCQRVVHGADGSIRVKSEPLHGASSPSNCRSDVAQ